MKQKYFIMKDGEKKQLIIREFAELDKDSFSPLCEETYDAAVIESSIEKGKEALLSVLKTKNMYPPGFYAEKIADAVMEIFDSEEKPSVELFFDDLELIAKSEEAAELLASIDSESEEIEDIIETDYDDDYEDKDALKNINSPLKVADDEFGDVDDES